MNNQNDSFNPDLYEQNNNIEEVPETVQEASVEEKSASLEAEAQTDGSAVEAQREDYHAPFTAASEQSEEATDVPSKSDDGVYRYVFSAQTSTPVNPPEKKRGGFFHLLLAAVTVLLCVSLSFGAGFMGTLLANRLQTDDDEIIPAPKKEQLYQEDPATILEKESSEGSVYGSAGEDVFTISQVVRNVQDAVVVIDVQTAGYGMQVSESAGSGVIISAEGYILTCHHVVDGATSITVTLNSKSKYEAALVGSDQSSDLAVIRITPKEDEPLTFVEQGCSGNLVVGEEVIAIGNPLGTLGGTVTNGIISATERTITTSDGAEMTLLQTNAAINSGNSGGGLFNLDGKLVGIVNAKYAAAGVEGLAFAIPIDLAYTVQLDLIQYGYVRGVVDHGLQTLDVIASNFDYYRYRYRIDTMGVYVVSSKYDENLKNRDRIVSVNGKKIATTEELNEQIKSCKVGDTVTLEIEREKETGAKDIFNVNIVLREYVPDYISSEIK